MPNIFPLFRTGSNFFFELCLCCQIHLETTLVLLRRCLKVKKVSKTNAPHFPPFWYRLKFSLWAMLMLPNTTLKPPWYFLGGVWRSKKCQKQMPNISPFFVPAHIFFVSYAYAVKYTLKPPWYFLGGVWRSKKCQKQMPNISPNFRDCSNFFCELCLCCQIHLETSLVCIKICFLKTFPPTQKFDVLDGWPFT